MRFYRNVSRDDPVADAHDAQRDDRRIIGYCDECGEEIHGGDNENYGDEIFVRDGTMVHIDCLSAWTRHFIKEME